MERSKRNDYSPVPSDDVELAEPSLEPDRYLRTNFSSEFESSSEVSSSAPYTIGEHIQEKYIHSVDYMGGLLSGRGKELLVVFLITLLPSFVQPSKPGSPKSALHKVRKTDWLDGLRGLASLLVMGHHSLILWYPSMSQGWGSCPDCYHFLQLPIIRAFYAGQGLVGIFFVISGFSLSYGALGLMKNANKSSELLASLSSSTFRRGIRLILPPIVVTFFMMLATYHGLYGTGPGSREPPRFGTFLQSLWHWWTTVLEISDIFRPTFWIKPTYSPEYDINLWTIDIEFYGSLVIFVTLLGISRLRTNFRLLVLYAIALWLLYVPHVYEFLFISGVVLAELHYIREDRLSSQRIDTLSLRFLPLSSMSSKSQGHLRTAFWSTNFLIGLYLLGMPLQGYGAARTPGYQTLSYYIPSQYRAPQIEDIFWVHLAAVQIIWTVDNAPFLQSIFTTPFVRYLGKIGFSLYMIHGSFLYTIGWHWSLRIHAWTGTDTNEKFSLGVFLTVLCVFPLIFWTADLVWRFVDNKSVALARWLYGLVSVPVSA